MADNRTPAALRAIARLAAQAGAEVALGWRDHADRLRIEEKAGPADLVSQADREAETAIRAVLSRRCPDDGILGEEHGGAAGHSGVHWIIDPIDGTTSYLYGRADWSVSVAAADTAGDRLLAAVVLEPALGRITEASAGDGTCLDGTRTTVSGGDDLTRALIEVNLGTPAQRAYTGRMVAALTPRVRDLRRGGSAAAALALVATGRADGAWLPGIHSWDCAAGTLLVQEAGGVVGDLTGVTPDTWPHSGDVLAGPPALWEPLRRILVAAGPGPQPLSPEADTDGVK
ncbi:inositol monophosphatase family protein [Actinoplanes teichomyceticus]|uniref:inositol-phosphate phosphatase n=1 Tax=Actinoplanes teichomyceticus TaxID=1867 RepID=A0A561WBC3_ACTTI|nr:inositol monophosphatase family protein [Actinoplanes teichomyceticus]TWG21158.1 myo-inositol-1(or 4)-monophosphatase [Actinoplanes teichomyceticus]GIF14980.1 inositol monophosphatase [Actinoplanes teichomyceticus]